MIYVKTNNSKLLKYPYTYADLYEENPYSSYDFRYTLSEWYSQTEEGLETDNQVVEVTVVDPPKYDSTTHYVEQKASPKLVKGKWILEWEIIEISAPFNYTKNVGNNN